MAEYSFDSTQLIEYTDELKAGDRVLLSGTVFTARDAAHKRIKTMLDNGESLPFDYAIKDKNTNLKL